MTVVRHVLVGAPEHGVVRHGRLVAAALGHDVMAVADAAAAATLDLDGSDVVHIPFTDRLFAPVCEQSAIAFQLVADRVAAAGAALSVTLHDVPRGQSPLEVRRRETYRTVIRASRGVVVNSYVEVAAVQDDTAGVHSVAMIPLPVEPVAAVRAAPRDRDVVVLGFVFPDRGHEQVLQQLPTGSGLVALGGASAGHEDLPDRLAEQAAVLGKRWRTTGFVPDGELSAHLARAAVPVAPNVRVAASASIATWLAHGRRPLVPDIGYTRELLAASPGTLTLYDPDDPGALHDAIVAALDDPDSTWLPAGVPCGPGVREVAARYDEHLRRCAPPRLTTRPDGAVTVPSNRWDLLVGLPERARTVSVVVPYYDDQRRLDLVLTGLSLQTIDPALLEIVVADDGSPAAPDVSAAAGVAVRVVRQEHRGFGAGRARNLGARAARGDLVAFVDGDTVAEPGYLAALTRLPGRHGECIVVGRRRHAELAGWRADDVRSWFAGTAPAPRELDEPAWLRDAYAASADLLHADARSYRYVISAVLCLERAAFLRLGGFDERFSAYGGEDWEFARRAWLAGALLAHEPGAVAWHDGPDWAARGDAGPAAKNDETLALAPLLTDPGLRGGGQWLPYPRTLVLMDGADAAGVLATARSAFAAGADCGFRLTGADGPAVAARLADPRIVAGPPPPDVLARAEVVAQVHGTVDLADLDSLADRAARTGVLRTPGVVLRSTRAHARAGGEDDVAAELFGAQVLAGPRARPAGSGPVDLARALPAAR